MFSIAYTPAFYGC